MNIIKMNGKTYRVNGTRTITFPSGNEIEVADADFLYKGEWHKVKNSEINAKIAKKYRESLKNTIIFCDKECEVLERYEVSEEYAKEYNLCYRNRIKFVTPDGFIHDCADTF